MDSVFHRRFDLEETARAVGVSPVTVKSWLAKGHVWRGPSAAAEGGGGARRSWAFGFYTVMEMGVAKTLLDYGPSALGPAFLAAQAFAHMGEEFDGLRRVPSLPFRESGVGTLLVATNGCGVVVPWQPGKDVYAVARHYLGRPEGFVILDCDAVFARVVTGLGLDRNDVMRAAYAGQGA